MKKIQIKTYEMGESLFSAIIFLIFGIFLITNPVNLIKYAMYIVGGFVTLLGIFKILIFYKTTDGDKKDNITGAVFIIIGMAAILFTALFYEQVEMVLRIIFAVYLMYVGIFRLINAFKIKGDKKPYFINALIIILIALLLVIIPGLPLVATGILITIYAIAEIVGFVLGRKNGNVKVNDVAEAVIVNEKIENNSEDVKLLK